MFPIGLIELLGALLIVGVVLYLLAAAPGIDATIKAYVRLLILGGVAIWLIWLFVGLFGGTPGTYPWRHP